MKLSRVYITGLVLGMVMLGIFFLSSRPKSIDYYVLRPVDIQYNILASGKVSYPKPYSLYSSINGKIKSIYVKEGQTIKKGDPFLCMDDSEAASQLKILENSRDDLKLKLKRALELELPTLKNQTDSAEITLKDAQRALSRSRDLFNQKLIAPLQLEQAESQLEKAQYAYNQARLNLENFQRTGSPASLQLQISTLGTQISMAKKKISDHHIAAPFNGLVTEVAFENGQEVKPGQLLGSLIEDKDWIVEADVDQKEIPNLQLGLSVLIKLESYPEKLLSANLIYVCPLVDSEKGTCPLRIEILEKPSFIKYGMIANIEIPSRLFNQVLAVPNDYVQKNTAGSFVWTWDKDKARQIFVKTNPLGMKWTQLSDIPPGTKILSVPNRYQGKKIKLGKEIKPDAVR